VSSMHVPWSAPPHGSVVVALGFGSDSGHDSSHAAPPKPAVQRHAPFMLSHIPRPEHAVVVGSDTRAPGHRSLHVGPKYPVGHDWGEAKHSSLLRSHAAPQTRVMDFSPTAAHVQVPAQHDPRPLHTEGDEPMTAVGQGILHRAERYVELQSLQVGPV
jgi:hypothetical protein